MSKLGMISLGLFVLTFSTPVHAMNKVVYGTDDRRDIYQETNAEYIDLAASTAAMIPNQKMNALGDDVTIAGSTLGQQGICSDAKFADHVTAANCSGFLVGEDLLVTAGHCMKSMGDCNGSKWVFGYAYETSDITSSITVSKENVYGCKEIIEQDLSGSTQMDFALIRLDRKVTDREPLKVRTEGKIDNAENIVVIGHPTGLPTKIADNAWVRNNHSNVFFSANLDTFGGNSGSAVFNAETGVVEGILVRGEQDYVYDWSKGCRVPKQCTNDSCRGEDVTRITNVTKLMEILKK
ncbi:MAG: hypothetical protein BM556_11720 [Bacteriovorax sp. MedPE-SWde]|nr:MAG: hypothetical protein BM556_11720 [Bacteriovorax sp. MedPE-SWde]